MRAVYLFLALLAVSKNVCCQDITRNNTLRKAIFDSIRSSDKYSYLSDTRFVVKNIWASKKWAYLCALVQEKDGRYQGTDDQLDLCEIVLAKRGDRWVAVTDRNGFAPSPREAICSIAAKDGISDSILESVFEENMKKGF